MSLEETIREAIETETAAVLGHLQHAGRHDSEQRRAGLQDLSALGDGDCWYDNPTIGTHYAAWHHLQRATGLVATAIDMLSRHRASTHLHVVDLGCGTGALAGAMGVAVRSGCDRPPRVTIRGLDYSEPMLAVARQLQTLRPETDGFAATFERRSWLDPEVVEDRPPDAGAISVIVGSYIFDNSDAANERTPVLADRLRILADATGTEEMILVGGSSKKETTSRSLALLRESDDWLIAEDGLRATSRVSINGRSPTLGEARRSWYGDARSSPLLDKDPPVLDTGTLRWVVRRRSQRLDLGDARPPWPRSVMDDRQLEAATKDPRRSLLVTGAPGSGKTLVLVERVAWLLERTRGLRILVTSFNRQMCDLISLWLRQRHGQRLRIERDRASGDGWFVLHVGTTGAVVVCNRDKFRTRLFQDKAPKDPENFDHASIEEAVRWHTADGTLPPGSPARWRSLIDDRGPSFPEHELEAYIYGRSVSTLEEYMRMRRPGGGRRLGDEQKQLVWFALEWHRDQLPITLWGHFRKELHRDVVWGKAKPAQGGFDHILVDEAQDFSLADFDVLAALRSTKATPIDAFADPSQSVHLGRSWREAEIREKQGPRHREAVRLLSTYRLPWLTAMALKPLANEMLGTAQTYSPSRASFPGPRPVVLSADKGKAGLLEDIRSLARTHAMDVTAATGGRDGWLAETLRSAGLSWRRLDPRDVKGREFDSVVFDSTLPLISAQTHAEALFTTLTRSTRILIVVVGRRTLPHTGHCLRRLDTDFLRFHDAAARQAWRDMPDESNLLTDRNIPERE